MSNADPVPYPFLRVSEILHPTAAATSGSTDRTQPSAPQGASGHGSIRFAWGAAERRTLWALAAVAAVFVTGCLWWLGQAARQEAPVWPSRAELDPLLAAVHVVPARPSVPGYVRDCAVPHGCVFGPAWAWPFPAIPGSACDTRDRVLLWAAAAGGQSPGGTPSGGQISGGQEYGLPPPPETARIEDLYSGRVLAVPPTAWADIHIDHVFPLAAAWDLGAWAWPQAVRIQFANDIVRNLQATAGQINTAKSDATPADWMPPRRGLRCRYAFKYLTVAVAYALPVTQADLAALRAARELCAR